jgi:hypothetical protein
MLPASTGGDRFPARPIHEVRRSGICKLAENGGGRKMKKSNWMAGLVAGAGLALMAVAPAGAQDMAETYKNYHAGIYAKQLCTDTTFDQDEYGKLSEALDKKVNHELGAGERLSLIESMKEETKKLVKREGCESENVASLLKLYDELAGAQ